MRRGGDDGSYRGAGGRRLVLRKGVAVGSRRAAHPKHLGIGVDEDVAIALLEGGAALRIGQRIVIGCLVGRVVEFLNGRDAAGGLSCLETRRRGGVQGSVGRTIDGVSTGVPSRIGAAERIGGAGALIGGIAGTSVRVQIGEALGGQGPVEGLILARARDGGARHEHGCCVPVGNGEFLAVAHARGGLDGHGGQEGANVGQGPRRPCGGEVQLLGGRVVGRIAGAGGRAAEPEKELLETGGGIGAGFGMGRVVAGVGIQEGGRGGLRHKGPIVATAGVVLGRVEERKGQETRQVHGGGAGLRHQVKTGDGTGAVQRELAGALEPGAVARDRVGAEKGI